jgi:two-component SAPR family response regulator
VIAGGRVLWPSGEFANEQRAWELLLFLAVSDPAGVDRDAVGAALWREVELADVAGSLRHLRRRLRSVLVRAVPGLPETAPFRPDAGRMYRLDTSVISSDAHRFLELEQQAKADEKERLRFLEQALALYEGDLFDSPAAPQFGWVVDPGDDGTSLRQVYRQRYLRICRTVANLHSGGGPGRSGDRALHLYRRMVQDDPQSEDIWRALLTLHARRGDTAGLEREWKRLLDSLAPAQPEMGTTSLYRRLLAELGVGDAAARH